MLTYLVTVKLEDGYCELEYDAKSVREVKEWAAGLEGVIEVWHVTVKE